MLTAVMYHYVRDRDEGRFPDLRTLSVKDFRGQLEYILKHYRVCSAPELAEAVEGNGSIPQNACLLTFDDGFVDHYETVFPLLLKYGVSGCFYVPAKPVLEKTVLDVHKLHFVLAVNRDKRKLLRETLDLGKQLFPELDTFRPESLVPERDLHSRFDEPVVTMLKRLLQKALPESIRTAIVSELFARYVSRDEADFAKQLYLDVDQLQKMKASGMHIGGHGHYHRWMAAISNDEQRQELELTRAFVAEDTPEGWWSLAYPYGSFNAETLDMVAKLGCTFALTTEVGTNFDLRSRYELRRLDANDLPFTSDAPVCNWTTMVAQ